MSSKTDAVPAAPTTFDPALDPTKNLTDYASDAYLQRGRLLDKEVRDLVEQVDLSNKYLDEINKLIAEANTVLFGTETYSSTTWQADFSGTNKTITLDNGYGISIQPNGNVVITDGSNNSVTYSTGALFPAQAGSGPGNGIALDGDATIVLEDGTKITMQVDAANLVTSMVVTRGNQGITVTGVNTAPVATGPDLTGTTLDNNNADGDILVESGGLYNLVQSGVNVPFYGITSGTITEDQKAFIRDKLKITINLDGNLSEDTWKALKDQLIAARDNLTGSNQLQTVQLQSALTRYNQNYDAMSNSQNKIYALLKDILGNLK